MTRSAWFAAVGVLWPTLVVAQTFPINIHNHPQKQSYASADEYKNVCVDSQAHWEPGNPVVPLPPGEAVVTTHTAHLMICGPYMAEFATQPLKFTFALKTFHLHGKIGQLYAGILHGKAARDLIWDATGTSQQPDTTGDPNGLRTWTGSFWQDPDPNFPHGWIAVTLSALVSLTNGDTTDANAVFPLFSMVDPSMPEEYGYPMAGSRPRPFSPRRPDVQFGAMQIDIIDPLPLLAPITAPWQMRISDFRYGGQGGLPDPIFKIVVDLDLHNGIPGRTLYTIDNPPENLLAVLNPLDIGSGTHKVAFIFIQPDGGLEKAAALVTFDLVVGQDIPPPPPTSVWKTIDQTVIGADTIILQQFGTERRWRLCVNNVCGPEQP